MLGSSHDCSEKYLDQIISVYAKMPQSLTSVAKLSSRPLFINPCHYINELAPHVSGVDTAPLIELLQEFEQCFDYLHNSDEWQSNQSLRLEFARIYSWVEALFATIELTDPGCRKALGLEVNAEIKALEVVSRHSVYLTGYKIARSLDVITSNDSKCNALSKLFYSNMKTTRHEILSNRYVYFQIG